MSKYQEASETSRADDVSAHQIPRKHEPLHLTRYLIFFVLEAGFTALAWLCYAHPRVLPWFNLQVEDTTIRSGLTAIFSLWQTSAVEGVLYICSSLPGQMRAERDDSEPSDPISIAIRFVSDMVHSSKTVKIALFSYPVLILFRIIGNSTITVSDGVGSARPIPIGLIPTFSLDPESTDISNQAFIERMVQTDMIVRLEQVYRQAWGYVSQPNYLIPLPTQDLDVTTKVLYETDVVSFHHDCQWKAPDSYSGHEIKIGNDTWTAGFGSNATVASETSIVEYGPSIVFLLPENQNMSLAGVSAYLFLGCNSTIPSESNTTSVNTSIDLSDLPTIYDPDGFTGRFTSNRALRAPLASVLVCNPQLKFMSRNVLLFPTANRTDPDITILSNIDVPSPGNIHPQAARNLFSVLLNATIMSSDPFNITERGSTNYNWVSATMLLSDIENYNTTSFTPFDLATINQNVDTYTLSAFKAFISGYQGRVPKLRSQQNVFAQSVEAEFTSSRLALWTSFPFVIIHTSLFGLLGVVLAGLVYSERVSRRT